MSRYNSKNNNLVVNVEKDFFEAFQKGKTQNEVYLPLTPRWGEVLLDSTTKKMREDRKGIMVTVQYKKTVLERKLLYVSIRWVPIRKFERADKHLVLLLGN